MHLGVRLNINILADRILYKHSRDDASIKCLYYSSILNTFGSDHQPVTSSFILDF